MFFKQVWRNAAKNRKGNGIFFGSLVIAVIAFYTLLSLGKQDVMIFLAEIESDAVNKLLMLLRAVYVMSLFFVFFLVFFACRYQTDSRRRELGMYLMLGMKRSRLFFMLLCETLWNSLISLFIGIPSALLLTEAVSLVTAKFVGLGIIGHSFTFSTYAVLMTVCGYVLVQLVTMLLISIPLMKAEPAELISSGAAGKQTDMSSVKSSVYFFIGAALLLIAYYLGIFRMRTLDLAVFAVLLICGAAGTFLLYKGFGGFLGRRIRKKSADTVGLSTFTGRQIQENVIGQYRALSVSSLLLLIALACVSYGISMGFGRTTASRSVDFSVFGDERDVLEYFERDGIKETVKDAYPMQLSLTEEPIDFSEITDILKASDETLDFASSFHTDHIISESSYNRMAESSGGDKVSLDDGKVALYTSALRESAKYYGVLQEILRSDVHIGFGGASYEVCEKLYSDNIVADRAITLYTALIVPDNIYEKFAKYDEPFCVNVFLDDDLTSEKGLMQSIQQVSNVLDTSGFEYESYLKGIGRNLFYSVSAGYLTVYLGVLFLLISNTVIGLKYLISQRQSKHRYITLLMLGSDTESLCRSVGEQINTFFSLVLSVAVISSAAAIYTMFTSLTRLPSGTSMLSVAVISGIAMAAFVLIETVYIHVVKKNAYREIRTLEITDRGE